MSLVIPWKPTVHRYFKIENGTKSALYGFRCQSIQRCLQVPWVQVLQQKTCSSSKLNIEHQPNLRMYSIYSIIYNMCICYFTYMIIIDYIFILCMTIYTYIYIYSIWNWFMDVSSIVLKVLMPTRPSSSPIDWPWCMPPALGPRPASRFALFLVKKTLRESTVGRCWNQLNQRWTYLGMSIDGTWWNLCAKQKN